MRKQEHHIHDKAGDRLIGGLTKALNKLTGTYTVGEDSSLRAEINDLKQRMEELFMGAKEDLDTLTGKFDSLESAVVAVADDIAALKAEIAAANANANIDLSLLIARADGIEAGLRAAVGAGPGSDV